MKTSRPRRPRLLRWALLLGTRVLLPGLIVAAALGFAKHQMDTRPQARRKRPASEARLVRIETVAVTPLTVTVEAMGLVVPARRVTLSPEVAGRVVALHPDVLPGGRVRAGQVLVTLDDRDYRASLEQRLSDEARVRLEHALEQGNQTIARQEYALLGEEVTAEERALVLRQPQRDSAAAALRAAAAAVARARLDVERCRVRAPFNAVVEARPVEVGARVAPGSGLMTLAGTDRFWIEVKVPVDELAWITIPREGNEPGSPVQIFDRHAWGPEASREGAVLRLEPGLEPQGRLARLLVAVDDPLALAAAGDRPRLLLDAYVRVAITGRTLTGGMPLPREYLRNGDQVWVLQPDDTLGIRTVTVGYRGRRRVYVTEGLRPEDRVVVTDMAAPVAGMPLRLGADPASASGGQP